jgi:serine/threonine protein kinase
MASERWQQVNNLYHAALERDPSQRAAFLNHTCSGDTELRREVESLLASHEQAGNFIAEPALKVAARVLAADQSISPVGRMLSHYRIESLLGAGGMGEVYLAEDIQLGRQVALKLLPTHFTQDKDRLRRFEQEARAASALNHPNVCVIYEIGKTDEDVHYITMEHVAGVTVRQQMATHPTNLGQALDVATQIAAALEAAHGAGIVHRDIKPENVMVRNDGLIKVLDFGLAKRHADPITPGSQTPTDFLVKTGPGMIMGTGGYMSPEQARGLEVDERTDIWSLGVVLYEMVAGTVPFAGATASDLIVSILDRESLPLSSHRPDVPPELQSIISKALRKDREERYQVVKNLFLDLKNLKLELDFEAKLQHSAQLESSEGIGSRKVTVAAAYESGRQTRGVQATTLSGKFPNRKPLFWTAGILGGLMLLALVAWYLPHRASDSPQPSLIATPLTTDPGFEGMPSLSPDGNRVAFSTGGPQIDNFDINVKQIGGGPPQRLTSDPAVDEFPAWSPDSRSIAFIRYRHNKMEVLLIPSLGGPER